MKLMVEECQGQLRITVQERRLDAANASRFRDLLRPKVNHPGPPVMIDLSAVDFIDSSGLGAVVAIKKAMDPGRDISLYGLSSQVSRVFQLTRMDRVFTLIPAIKNGAYGER